MASIADFFSVVGALGAIVIIPAAYQPIYHSAKAKNYKILLSADWGNEGDISISYPHFIHIRLAETEGDWKFSGELCCSVNHDEKFIIHGKLKCLSTLEISVHRTIGWREYKIGEVKIKFDRRTSQCRFIPQKYKKNEPETDCERAIFSAEMPLWRHYNPHS